MGNHNLIGSRGKNFLSSECPNHLLSLMQLAAQWVQGAFFLGVKAAEA
jgi:hypothetical protein